MPPDRDGAEIEALVERKKARVQPKSDFTVEHLGKLLVETAFELLAVGFFAGAHSGGHQAG